jgi:hypothetical protein
MSSRVARFTILVKERHYFVVRFWILYNAIARLHARQKRILPGNQAFRRESHFARSGTTVLAQSLHCFAAHVLETNVRGGADEIDCLKEQSNAVS